MKWNNWLKLDDCYDLKWVILNTVSGNTCFIIIVNFKFMYRENLY